MARTPREPSAAPDAFVAAARLRADLQEERNRLAAAKLRSRVLRRTAELARSAGKGRARRPDRDRFGDQGPAGPLAFTNSYRSSTTRLRQQLGGSGSRTPVGPPDAHLDEISLSHLRRDSQDVVRKCDTARVLTDAVVGLTVGDGSHVRPATSSKAFNDALVPLLKAWWDGIGPDPATGVHGVDARGMVAGPRWEFDNEAQVHTDGDLALVLIADGSVQVVSADRVTSQFVGGGRATLESDWTRGTAGESCGVLCDRLGRITGLRVADYALAGAGVDPGRARVLGAGSFLWYTNPLGRSGGVNQTRGEPTVAPVYDHVLLLERAAEAAQLAQYMAACMVSWRETADPAGQQATMTGETVEVPNGDGTTNDEKIFDIAPGAHMELGKGEKAGFFSPNQPSPQYDAFVSTILRTVCARYGLAMILAFFDPRGINLSTYRGLVLATAQRVRVQQQDRVARVLSPLYRWRVAMFIRERRLPAPPKDWDAHEWIVNPPPVLDPEAEARTWALLKEKGFATRDMGTRSMWGITGTKMVDDLVAEQEYEDEAGLVTMTTPGQQVADAAAQGKGPATPSDPANPDEG